MAEYLAPVLDGADIVGTVQAGDMELAYEQFGHNADPAMILITGLGAQLTAWPDAFCRALANSRLRVIRFDNRDVGLSSKLHNTPRHDSVSRAFFKSMFGRPIAPAYTLGDMARDTLGLMDALEINQAHLVGVSMGGMIAQIMAGKMPERVLSLTSIMSTTSARKLPRARLRILRRMAKNPDGDNLDAIAAYKARTMRMIGSPKFGRSQSDWEAEIRRSLERNYHPAGSARQTLAVLAAAPRHDLLARVSCPALVVHGSADPMLSVKHGRATARALPHAKYMEVPGMGHDLPPRLLPELVDWLVELTGTTTHPDQG